MRKHVNVIRVRDRPDFFRRFFTYYRVLRCYFQKIETLKQSSFSYAHGGLNDRFQSDAFVVQMFYYFLLFILSRASRRVVMFSTENDILGRRWYRLRLLYA